MSKVTVHWAWGKILDCGDYYSIKAKFEDEDGFQEAFLCSVDEDDIQFLSNHFSYSIEPVEIHFP